jgi:hypothetical protein
MKEERYNKMVSEISLAIYKNSNNIDSEIIHQICEILKKNRPDKSKRFAEIKFLKDCGLV